MYNATHDAMHTERTTQRTAQASSVTLFLNRLLGLSLSQQAELLHLFKFLCRRTQRQAERNGTLEDTLQELHTRVYSREQELTDAWTHSCTYAYASSRACMHARTHASRVSKRLSQELPAPMLLRTARWIHPAAPPAAVATGVDAGTGDTTEADRSRLLLLELLPSPGCVDFAAQLALVRRAEPLPAAAAAAAAATAATAATAAAAADAAAKPLAGLLACR